MTKPMPDEYYQRYRTRSHEELYTELMAGKPSQINGMVPTWKSAEGSAQSVSDSLTKDLERLLPTWNSSAGREFQRRLGLIATFAGKLADEFNAVHTGLTTMAAALETAQSKAEDPQKTDDLDKTLKGAAKGAAVGSVLGPVGTVGGGVIGGVMGHDQDEEEKAKAKERTVVLVAALAADYGVTDHGWPKVPVIADPDLPGGDTGGAVTPAKASHGSVTHHAPSTGVSDRTTKDLDPAARAGQTPDASGIGDRNTSTIGPDTTTTGFTTDPDESTGTGLQSGGGGLTGAGGFGNGGLGGTGLGGAGGGFGGTGAFGAGSGTSLSSGSLGSTALAGLGGAGGGLGGSGGVGDGRSAAGSIGRGAGTGSGRSASGHGSGHGDDEADEHMTWLTEDDMVWGGGEAPDGVLGSIPHGDDRTPE
ncbi:hypothetical protein [Actinoplanes sp. NPDC051851]|uniref:hypothetical protein n=1 Tax=Actinoplanes sp. NPDC051851 TaxID=3154753 RepID=UPI00342D754E